jgi:hypothetical protein
MVLIGYDGSKDAKEGIRQAAELLGDAPATVLTVWQPAVAQAPATARRGGGADNEEGGTR